jgi:hypothetical protein
VIESHIVVALREFIHSLSERELAEMLRELAERTCP